MILDEQLHLIPQFEIIVYEEEDDDVFKGFGEGWMEEEEE